MIIIISMSYALGDIDIGIYPSRGGDELRRGASDSGQRSRSRSGAGECHS